MPFGPMIATRSPRSTLSETSRAPVVAVGLPEALDLEHLRAARAPLAEAEARVAARALRQRSMTIFSISLILLCACRALVALARKRSTKAWCSAISASRLVDLGSRRSRSRAWRRRRRSSCRVERGRLVVDVDDVGADVVEEAVVVRDHHEQPL
jgi:hypothetical protein